MNNAQRIFEINTAKIISLCREIMPIIGNEAVNWSQDNFRLQGWRESTLLPWQPRISKRDPGRAILIKSGRLLRSIRITAVGDLTVSIGTDVPYARIHNYGGEVNRYARSETFLRNRISKGIRKGQFKKGVKAGKGFTFSAGGFNMPQRQFLGNSPMLQEQINKTAKELILSKLNS